MTEGLRAAGVIAGVSPIVLLPALAQASVVSTDLGSGVSVDSTNQTYEIDFDGDGLGDLVFFSVSPPFTSATVAGWADTSGPLAPGALIDGSLSYSAITLVEAADKGDEGIWKKEADDPVRGYLGVALDLDLDDILDHYGWVDLEVSGADMMRIFGYAYETSGGAIRAGEVGPDVGIVPLPASILMLASGVAGLAAFRRRARPVG